MYVQVTGSTPTSGNAKPNGIRVDIFGKGFSEDAFLGGQYYNFNDYYNVTFSVDYFSPSTIILPPTIVNDTQLYVTIPDYSGYGNATISIAPKPGLYVNGYGSVPFNYTTTSVNNTTLDTNNVVIVGQTITVNGTHLNYMKAQILYQSVQWNGLIDTVVVDIDSSNPYSYNSDYTQFQFTIPNDPKPITTHSMSLLISLGNGYPIIQTNKLIYQKPFTYQTPQGDITSQSAYAHQGTINVNGLGLLGMAYADVAGESVPVISCSPDGHNLTIGTPFTNSGHVNVGSYNVSQGTHQVLFTTTGTFTCIKTPFIDSFYPTNGAAGTTVDLYGYNLSRNGSVPTITFNGVSSPNVTILSSEHIRVIAPNSYTGRIVLNNNSTGSFTSQIDYTYPPAPITVTYTAGGTGSISGIQYSKNGGSWTSMPSSMVINNTDMMSYRATFTKQTGKLYMDVQINTPSSSANVYDSTSSSSLTETTWTSFKNLTGYNVSFYVSSYGTSGGGGGGQH